MSARLDTAALRRTYALPCTHDDHGIYRDFTAALDEVDRLRQECHRLNSLAAHHAGNRAMQDVEIGQLRAKLTAVRDEAASWRSVDPSIAYYQARVLALIDQEDGRG